VARAPRVGREQPVEELRDGPRLLREAPVGEPDDPPAVELRRRIADAVGLECRAVGVEGVAVDLDDDVRVGPVEVTS